MLLLLVQLLLLDRCFKLMLVFKSLPLHVFLACQALFVSLPALLPHLLLLRKLLLIALQLKLHLILSLSLLHFLLILDGLALLLLLYLRFLNA